MKRQIRATITVAALAVTLALPAAPVRREDPGMFSRAGNVVQQIVKKAVKRFGVKGQSDAPAPPKPCPAGQATC